MDQVVEEEIGAEEEAFTEKHPNLGKRLSILANGCTALRETHQTFSEEGKKQSVLEDDDVEVTSECKKHKIDAEQIKMFIFVASTLISIALLCLRIFI